MRISGQVMWRERYQGRSGVYLRGVDMETGGDVELMGQFGEDIPLMVQVGFEAVVTGRVVNGVCRLRAVEFRLTKGVPKAS